MQLRHGITSLSLTALVLSLATSPAWATSHTTIQRAPVAPAPLRVPPSPPAPSQLQGPTVINLKSLTNKQIRALPNTAVVEFQGKPTTMGALRALEAEARKATLAKAQAAATQAKARAAARRAQFLQQQAAELQAIHAKARVEVARLRQASAVTPVTQQEAIRNEAIQLMQRAKTASPAEQVQIEQRAGQLLKQLQQPKLLQQAPRLQQLPR